MNEINNKFVKYATTNLLISIVLWNHLWMNEINDEIFKSANVLGLVIIWEDLDGNVSILVIISKDLDLVNYSIFLCNDWTRVKYNCS